MTTIALKSGVVAGDTLVTAGGLRVGYMTKIGMIGDMLYGAAGRMKTAQEWIAWVKGGMKEGGFDPTGWLDADGEQNGLAFIYKDGVIIEFGPQGTERLYTDEYAIGSGCMIARGAMAVGASAIEAVEAAILLDTGTGGKIEHFSLN